MHGIHKNLQLDVEAKPTILPDLGQTINGPFVTGVGIQKYDSSVRENKRQIAKERPEPRFSA
jgi:hypothetical protein